MKSNTVRLDSGLLPLDMNQIFADASVVEADRLDTCLQYESYVTKNVTLGHLNVIITHFYQFIHSANELMSILSAIKCK